MPKAAKDHDGSGQIDTFIKTARALGCDEDKERFEAALARIAKGKRPPKASAKQPIRTGRDTNK
jgi:hypothetical protein